VFSFFSCLFPRFSCSARGVHVHVIVPLQMLCDVSFRVCAFLTLLAWASPSRVRAQDLPTITYTTTDGLTHDIATRVLQDTRGFLWVGGPTALSRFDGERFTSYGRAEGLDVGTGVNDLKLGSRGDLWIGTNGAGIFRFDLTTPDRTARLTRFTVGDGRPSNRVNVVMIAPDGRLWAGTDAGLFVGGTERPFERVPLPPGPGGLPRDSVPISAMQDDGSSLWIGTTMRVYHCAVAPPHVCREGPPGRARALLLGENGRLWIAGDEDLEAWSIDAARTPGGRPEVTLKGSRLRRMLKVPEGILGITEDRRLITFDGSALQVLYTSNDASRLNDVIVDESRNLWLATNGGLVAIRRQVSRCFRRTQASVSRTCGRCAATHGVACTR
jgi:ligand-binding sensor domain-containing protein